MSAESNLTERQLQRLIKAAAVRADSAALAKLREWSERYPDAARHKARFDSRLDMILADFTAEPARKPAVH